MGEQKDIATLAEALKKADEEYVAAKKEESFARNAATDALNKLNQAQKAFDAAVESIRDAAPFDSEWKSNKRQHLYAVDAAGR